MRSNRSGGGRVYQNWRGLHSEAIVALALGALIVVSMGRGYILLNICAAMATISATPIARCTYKRGPRLPFCLK